VFFPIDAEDWSKALGQIRRLRHSRNWKRIGSSDLYWNAAFFAVLVDTVDSLLIDNLELAFELSSQGILVAERIRPEACPGGSELGKRSLRAWAQAVHGSSCRALERYDQAEDAFQQALGLASRGVMHWAAAEVWRRFAVLLLAQGSLAGLAFVDKALESYNGFPAGRADALVLRGLFHHFLRNDHCAAAQDTSKALDLVQAKRSPREGRTWWCALNNLRVIYTSGTSDLPTLEATLSRVRMAGRKLTRHEPLRRMFCLWIQGLLLAPLGASRKAERFLTKAMIWLYRNQYSQFALLCSVDLAWLNFRAGDEDSAMAILSKLPRAGGDARLRTYLDANLEKCWSNGLGDESLAAVREALTAISSNSREVEVSVS
jgi:tetratricopeptide (TPR) repeat protein